MNIFLVTNCLLEILYQNCPNKFQIIQNYSKYFWLFSEEFKNISNSSSYALFVLVIFHSIEIGEEKFGILSSSRSYWPEQFQSIISYWPQQFWSIMSYWPELFQSMIPYWTVYVKNVCIYRLDGNQSKMLK